MRAEALSHDTVEDFGGVWGSRDEQSSNDGAQAGRRMSKCGEEREGGGTHSSTFEFAMQVSVIRLMWPQDMMEG